MAVGEDKFTLTVTPPLFKVNINPGGLWSSSVKIANNNSSPVTIYTQVIDFKAKENGGIEFIKEYGSEQGGEKKIFLSQWVDVSKESIVLEAYKSADIPFTIRVPEDAQPGGHYAAILTGNKPAEKIESGTGISISSMLATLIMLRVSGDIKEEGNIREFSTDKKFYKNPEVLFNVKFENSGNVHLQPRGEIRIFNIFNKVKGVISVNDKTEFGNVLPESLRKWEFLWKEENSIFPFGRYKADLVLSYGEEAKQTDFRTLNFWIFDIKTLLPILGSIIFFLLLIILLIRLYIKKSVKAAQMQAGIYAGYKNERIIEKKENTKINKINEKSKSIINLRDKQLNKSKSIEKQNKNFFYNWALLKKIIIIFIIFVLVISVILLFFYYKNNSKINLGAEKNMDIKVEIDKSGAINSQDEVDKNNEKFKIEDAVEETDEIATTTEAGLTEIISGQTGAVEDKKEIKIENFIIKILNGSGVKGAANKAEKLLNLEGYNVFAKGNADNFEYDKTKVIYKDNKLIEAENLSKILVPEGMIEENNKQEENFVIILGKDFK